MRTFLKVAAAGLALALGVAILPPPPSRAQAASPSVKIAVVSSLTRGLPAAIVSVAMRPLKAYMESQTGMSGDIVPGGDALELGKKLDDDAVQIGVFHGHEFAWAKKKFPNLEPIVVCLSASPNVRAVQVVAVKSAASGYADLKGGTLALPRENRAFCRIYAERRCVPPGTSIEAFYKRITSPIDAEDALDAVAGGKVGSAVVEAPALEAYRKAKPAWARYVRVLHESELFPPGVIACKKGKFNARQFAAFRAALVNAGDQPRGREVMTNMRVAAFSPAPENFQAILDASHKAYPPPAK